MLHFTFYIQYTCATPAPGQVPEVQAKELAAELEAALPEPKSNAVLSASGAATTPTPTPFANASQPENTLEDAFGASTASDDCKFHLFILF